METIGRLHAALRRLSRVNQLARIEYGEPSRFSARAPAPAPAAGRAAGLRIALFSGNYNMVRDGANKALNRLVRYLLAEGASVRIYSPTIAEPAFAPAGDLVSVPSVPIPGRPEYRLGLGLPKRVQRDIEAFRPNLIHVSAPDIIGHRAQRLARKLGVPVVASLHTLFQTYLSYYHLDALRPLMERGLDRFYGRCDWVLAPNEPLADELREKARLADRVRIWSRGVDHALWNPEARDLEWRRAQGYGDDEAVLLFFGRVVKEKGLDIFEETIASLRARGRRVRPLIVGSGPAESDLAQSLGDAVFTGHIEGKTLARAVASADILVNPSTTEAFGNVNLEAMACGLAVVSARAPAAEALIDDERTGLLVEPRDVPAWADAVDALIDDPARRRQLGESARRASEAYRWSCILDRVIETYRLAVAEGPRRPEPRRARSGRRLQAA
jgi:phosphatidylinositol alpha 1,6-mannosyltransferase